MIKKGIAILSALTLLVMAGCTTGGTKFNNDANNNPNRNIGTNDTRGVDDNRTLDNNLSGLTRDGAYDYDNAQNGNLRGETRNTDLEGNINNAGNNLRNNVNNGENNVRNNANNMRNNNQMDWDLVDRIENLCEDEDMVNDATVAINDNDCYVGLDLGNEGKIPEDLKENLSSEIKRQEPNITKVHFTEDRGAIENFVDRLGDTIEVDWHELENIFR